MKSCRLLVCSVVSGARVQMRYGIVTLLLVVSMLGWTAHAAGQFTLGVVADTNTAVPGESGNFIQFDGAALDGNQVAFRGLGSTTEGIFLFDGGNLSVVANNSTSVPGGTGSLQRFGSPALDGGRVAFAAEGSTGSQGVYRFGGGSPAAIADTGTPVPGGTGNFSGFEDPFALVFFTPSLRDDKLAFTGFNSSSQPGVYRFDGGLFVVADTNTAIPSGTGNFTNITGDPSLDESRVAFTGSGSSGQNGVYLLDGNLSVVANTNTAIPGGTGSFSFFGDPSLDGSSVAFTGSGGSGQNGVYLRDGGLSVVADTSTPIPGGTGNFSGFVSVSLHNGSVVFDAFGDSGQRGIYLFHDGDLSVIADTNTPIPGGTGNFDFLVAPSLHAGSVVFQGLGAGGQNGVYLGTAAYHWVSGVSGQWDNPTNWSFGALPGSFGPTFIDPEHGVNVTGPGAPANLRSLTIGSTISGVAELRTQPTGQLTINESLIVEAAGKLTVDGAVSVPGAATTTNFGEIELVQGSLLTGAATLVNHGVVRGSGTIGQSLDNQPAGEVRVAAGDRLRFTGTSIANAGRVEAIGSSLAPAEVEFAAAVANAASTGMITGRNAMLRFNGGLNNAAALALSFGTSDVFGDVVNTSSGTIAVAGNSQATFYDDVTNNGTLNVAGGSTAVFFGALAGNGNVGSGDVQALGDLLPGSSPGLMQFGGNLALGPLTNLEIELGGLNAGSEFDVLDIAGVASLGGTLQVLLIDAGSGPFVPAAGDMFEIISAAAGISGTFMTELLPALAGDLFWSVNYEANSVTLTVAAPGLPGDLNGDGAVDAADYVFWRKNAGTPLEYDEWRANFGLTVGGGASSHAAVPEPAALVLLVVGALAMYCRRRAC